MKSAAILCCVLFALTMAQDEESAKKLLYQGNNGFTTKFFQSVVKAKAGSSVVMSAYSVLTPLAQLSIAAEGPSQTELLESMGLPNADVVKVAFKADNKELSSVEGVTLKTASRIYIGMSAQLNDDFNAISKDVFNSEVKNVNFADSKATAGNINQWVESQTNNRIKDLVDPSALSAKTRAVLVNAIYFKGTWEKTFDSKLTLNKDFFVTKDTKMDVPMMFQKNTFLYASSPLLNAQLLEIPYAKNQASFLIILPNEVDGIAALEEKLKDPNVLSVANKQMNYEDVNLYLPKFKIETTINLKNVLQEMGVTKIFNPGQANLKKLLKTDEDVYISEAVQKAFIEVNEEGAEAAAANAFLVSFTTAVVAPNPPKEFNANHPFVFAIKVQDKVIFNGVLRQ